MEWTFCGCMVSLWKHPDLICCIPNTRRPGMRHVLWKDNLIKSALHGITSLQWLLARHGAVSPWSIPACPPLLAWGMSGRWACCTHTHTVHTPVSGKGRCSTRRDLRFTMATCAGRRTTMALKPREGYTKSKIGAISGPQNGTCSNKETKRN